MFWRAVSLLAMALHDASKVYFCLLGLVPIVPELAETKISKTALPALL